MTGLLIISCSAKVYSEAPELQEMNPYLKSHFVPQFQNLYPWITSDPETRPIAHAFIKRRDFIPDKTIWKRVKKSIEHGMYQRIIMAAESCDLTDGLSFYTKGAFTVKKKNIINERLFRVLKETEDERSRIRKPQSSQLAKVYSCISCFDICLFHGFHRRSCSQRTTYSCPSDMKKACVFNRVLTEYRHSDK